MKKTKRFKAWKLENDFINKQKSLPMGQKLMGNAKSNCYTCIYAGYIFNAEKQCFEPYCTKKGHPGRIVNYSLNKWNDNFDERSKNYEDFVINQKDYRIFRIA